MTYTEQLLIYRGKQLAVTQAEREVLAKAKAWRGALFDRLHRQDDLILAVDALIKAEAALKAAGGGE